LPSNILHVYHLRNSEPTFIATHPLNVYSVRVGRKHNKNHMGKNQTKYRGSPAPPLAREPSLSVASCPAALPRVSSDRDRPCGPGRLQIWRQLLSSAARRSQPERPKPDRLCSRITNRRSRDKCMEIARRSIRRSMET
jgi:hypothetical protein